jgi:hypothetical protein
MLGFDRVTNEFRVIQVRQESYIAAGYNPIPDLEQHGHTHEWPTVGDGDSDGSDLSYIYWPQIVGLRPDVSDTGAFYVSVGAGILPRQDGVTEVVAQEADLSGSVPGSGARWVHVYLDDNGLMQTTDGDVVPAAVISTEDIPRPASASDFEICAVLLWNGQTEILYDRDRQDILDLRWPNAGIADPWATTWDNVHVVAKGGGQSTTVQAGVNAIASLDTVWVMPGLYLENVVVTTDNITIQGLVNRYGTGPHGSSLSGSNDTGPILRWNADSGANERGHLAFMLINRTLSGGAGDFIAVDANGACLDIVGCTINVGAGATGRDILVRIGITGSTSYIKDTVIVNDVEATGGDLLIEDSTVGSIECTSVTDVFLLSSSVLGDVTGIAGCDLFIVRGSYITGTVSGFDNVYYRGAVPPDGFTQDISVTALGVTTVEGLQGRSISAAAPSAEQVLTWDGTSEVWKPADAPGGSVGVGRYTPPTSPRWYVDGALSTGDEQDGVYYLADALMIEYVTLYVRVTGSASSTIVDVDYSTDDGSTWSSVFAVAGNRPEVTNGGANLDTGTLSIPRTLPAGTLLRMNIDQIATDAEDASVQVHGQAGDAVSGELTLLGAG